MGNAELSSPRWQRFRRHLIDSTPHPVCHLCGHTIDTSIKYPDPESVVVDHLVPRSDGGEIFDPANCALAHKVCNERRGVAPLDVASPSRDW